MTGTGQLPKFEDDAYKIAGDDLFLIPTAEVPVTNLYRDEILDAAMLPKGSAPTRRASAARPDRRGRTRAAFSARTSSTRSSSCATARRRTRRRSSSCCSAMPKQCCSASRFPYRVKLLAAGDTGFSSAKTYDLEAWAPGVGAWLEVSSVQHLHRLPGAAREHPLSAGEGREAAIRAHAERVGARLSAHHRLHSRASPAAGRQRRRSRSAAAISRIRPAGVGRCAGASPSWSSACCSSYCCPRS